MDILLSNISYMTMELKPKSRLEIQMKDSTNVVGRKNGHKRGYLETAVRMKSRMDLDVH